MSTLSSLTRALGLTCTLSLFAAGAQAQPHYTQLTTNPSSLLFGVLKLEAEVGLDRNFAIEPEVAIMTEGQRFWTADYESKGLRYGVVAKKYFQADMPHEGYYGMAYFRRSSFTFLDQVAEGETRDQRDLDRTRATLGFGAGYTSVGRDGFTLGVSFGIGRHIVDRKEYLTPATSVDGTVFDPFDAEFIKFPLDVYGRVSIGLRLYNAKGRERKDAYEAELEEWRAQREAILLERREERLRGL